VPIKGRGMILQGIKNTQWFSLLLKGGLPLCVFCLCIHFLALMEHSLTMIQKAKTSQMSVLILVLMEDALGEQKIDLSDNQCITIDFLQNSLNFHKN
jgi:hypothetical protein